METINTLKKQTPLTAMTTATAKATSKGNEKPKGRARLEIDGNRLTLNIEAARATVNAPITPDEAKPPNIGYECVYSEGQGLSKRRREESFSPGREVDREITSRMARKVAGIHAQLERTWKDLSTLIKENPNTKVEIKSGISALSSMVSQLCTAELKRLIGKLADDEPLPPSPCPGIMSDASTLTEGEGDTRREKENSSLPTPDGGRRRYPEGEGEL